MDGLVVDDPGSLQSLAERIDTGLGDPDRIRALAVFNLGPVPVSGVAVFPVDMRWPVGPALPPVVVRSSVRPVYSAVRNLVEEPIPDCADRKRVVFDLAFAVDDVPARGWRVYWAEYGEEVSDGALAGSAHPDLRVVETLCHGGDLPAVGSRLETFGPRKP